MLVYRGSHVLTGPNIPKPDDFSGSVPLSSALGNGGVVGAPDLLGGGDPTPSVSSTAPVAPTAGGVDLLIEDLLNDGGAAPGGPRRRSSGLSDLFDSGSPTSGRAAVLDATSPPPVDAGRFQSEWGQLPVAAEQTRALRVDDSALQSLDLV